MRVLHIANDYSGSKVYKELCSALDELGVDQTVYTAVRSETLVDRNFIHFKGDSKIIYRHILDNWVRFDYHRKIKRIFSDLTNQIDISDITVAHAHTLFSDGGVALKLFQEFNVPYLVTVRNTDLNLFFKYFFHLREHGITILKHAQKIIFISPVYSTRLFSFSSLKIYEEILSKKVEVIPNGIADFWINNVEHVRKNLYAPLQLLYIGKFSKGKNLPRLITAVKRLNDENIPCHLHLVGGGGDEHRKVLTAIEKGPYYSFHGQINDLDKLKTMFNSVHVFTMPSKAETFGLVYIEALSQSLPVLYTLNEGIYGFYNSEIGEAVDAFNINSIINGIKRIYMNYDKYQFDPSDIVKNHDWQKIALKYRQLYVNTQT